MVMWSEVLFGTFLVKVYWIFLFGKLFLLYFMEMLLYSNKIYNKHSPNIEKFYITVNRRLEGIRNKLFSKKKD